MDNLLIQTKNKNDYLTRKEKLETDLNNLLIENKQNIKRKARLNNNLLARKIIIKLLVVMMCLLWCQEIFSYEIYSLFNKCFFSIFFVMLSIPIEKKLTKEFNRKIYEKLIGLDINTEKNNIAIEAIKKEIKALKEIKLAIDTSCQVEKSPIVITGVTTRNLASKVRIRRKELKGKFPINKEDI